MSGVVHSAVHSDVESQKAIVTVYNIGINYVPNGLYEIDHTMKSTAI
jgi:hypothetical protein